MSKKAGIVVGIVIIVLAITIYVIAVKVGGGTDQAPEKDIRTEQKDITSVENEQPKVEKQQVVVQEPKEEVQVEPKKEVVVVEKEVPVKEEKGKQQTTAGDGISSTKVGGSTFQDISSDSLGEPVTTKTEIMVVSAKRIQLMDGKYGTDEDKQLVYVADLLGGKETYHLYLNGSAYKGVKVGDKLKVKYSIYKNASGVEFPVIINALSEEKD